MKKSIIVLFVFVLSSLALQAQESSTVVQDSIIFDKTTHDYGTLVQGGNGNCEFVFTNKGKTPLLLSNVGASCGCTVPEWPKDPILPGKTGVIKVTYNTAIIGVFNKSVTVYSNAANNPVGLIIKGNVNPVQAN